MYSSIAVQQSASPTRVLIIDDEGNMARSLNRVLRRSGYETEIALDGTSALMMLETFQPDIVTLDLRMPWMSGFHILETAKQSIKHHEVKVLVISGLPEWELENALQLGADAILSKPFDNDQVLKVIGKLESVIPTLIR